jgi:hypothetical protein
MELRLAPEMAILTLDRVEKFIYSTIQRLSKSLHALRC